MFIKYNEQATDLFWKMTDFTILTIQILLVF